jgi:lipid-binding SYLF domain-containing protein
MLSAFYLNSKPKGGYNMNYALIKKTLLISFLISFSAVILSNSAQAASATVIDAKVDDALKKFYSEVDGAKKLAGKSYGILIFPSVIKAGFGIGGEYGEGALQINGKTVDYYSTAAASIGFQLGAQAKTVILLFLTKKALTDFRNSEGWEVGVDASVAILEIGAGGSLDTTNINASVVGVVFGNKGLMYNLTFEGSKMTKIKR